jgi:hypothetical protein
MNKLMIVVAVAVVAVVEVSVAAFALNNPNEPSLVDSPKHGTSICTIAATFPNDGSGSTAQMEQTASDMTKFMEDCTKSWTVTLKNVS